MNRHAQLVNKVHTLVEKEYKDLGTMEKVSALIGPLSHVIETEYLKAEANEREYIDKMMQDLIFEWLKRKMEVMKE